MGPKLQDYSQESLSCFALRTPSLAPSLPFLFHLLPIQLHPLPAPSSSCPTELPVQMAHLPHAASSARSPCGFFSSCSSSLFKTQCTCLLLFVISSSGPYLPYEPYHPAGNALLQVSHSCLTPGCPRAGTLVSASPLGPLSEGQPQSCSSDGAGSLQRNLMTLMAREI